MSGSLLQKALQKAQTVDTPTVAKSIAILSQSSQEFADPAPLATDPISGYNPAQLAVHLYTIGSLNEFATILKEKSLSPNIVLANGMTLLQNSLVQFPKDTDRLNCLLEQGANPNLFLRQHEEQGFGRSIYRAAYHPMNYAFTNCPDTTTPEICATLRRYGASTDGLRYKLEVDPHLATPDDEAKANLRQSLIATHPNQACMKLVRLDIDLSIMQKELTNIQTQVAAAGFEIVNPTTTTTPKPQPQPQSQPLAPDQIGQLINGKGIYFGVWAPKSPSGKSIDKKYNIFAAPKDLAEVPGIGSALKFKNTVLEIEKLKDWYGHDGGIFKTENDLIKSFKNGKYNGEWFIPPLELLRGTDSNKSTVRPKNNLYDLRNSKDFKYTFIDFSKASDNCDEFYWSLTKNDENEYLVDGVSFETGGQFGFNKLDIRFSCRPCRAELIP